MSDTRAYEIIVGTDETDSIDMALLKANDMMKAADSTGLFVESDKFDRNLYGADDSDQQIGVGFCVVIDAADGDTFEDELDDMDCVETWERVHYTPS